MFVLPMRSSIASALLLELTCLYSWWSSSDITVFADPKDVQNLQLEYSMSLTNHRYEIDWLLGLVFSQQIGIIGVSTLRFTNTRWIRFLQGTKIVGKRDLSYIPILGWSWLFTESIFLRRIWESDKTVLEKDIQRLINGYPDQYHFNVSDHSLIDQSRSLL